FAGPGIVSGQTYSGSMGIDDMSANYMYALGLPAPVDSRGHVIPNFFTASGTPAPTPTTGIPSPTSTTNPTVTVTDTPTSTPTSIPTSIPTSTPAPPQGSGLIQNGGFETSSGWMYAGVSHPRRIQTVAHSGRYSLKLGYSSGQQGDSIAYQVVTIPHSAR